MLDFEDIAITRNEAAGLGILSGLGLLQKDIYKRINKQILQLLEESEGIPWRKPWRDGYKFKGVTYGAQNYVTGAPYRGANAYMVFLYNLINRTESIYFLTKKQIADRGGKLNADAKPLTVWAFIKGTKKELNKKGETIETFMQGIVTYDIYDLKDTEGVKPIKRKTIESDQVNEIIVEAQQIIDGMPKKPSITDDGGNEAYYSPYNDSVHMPVKKAFTNIEKYYGVLFHELIHSTGHKKRLERDMTGKYGSKSYAFEELIAEVGSAYLCGVTNIDYHTLKNSAAYLKSWAKTLKLEIANDKTFLFKAVLKATKAAKYIIGTTLDKKGEVHQKEDPIIKTVKEVFPDASIVDIKGKEITPNKKVKASVSEAVNNLVALPAYKNVGAMAMQMLYSSKRNNNFPDSNTGLKGEIFEKLEDNGFAEYNTSSGYYELTTEGEDLYKKIESRLETLKAKKAGTDLFPELAGTENQDPGLEIIQRYITLHNQVLSANHIKIFVENLQVSISNGKIKKDHPYAKEIMQIQEQLVKVHNSLGKTQLFKIHISNLARYKSIISKELSGLGFLPVIISAVAGKTVEFFANKALSKKKSEVAGLGSLENISDKNSVLEAAGFIRADKKIEDTKVPGTFRLAGELGKLLIDLQPYKLAITISGDPHAGKTEFVTQLMNSFAEIKKTVAAYMLEQGGMESKDTKAAIDRNVKPENLKHVNITGEASNGLETIKTLAASGAVSVIIIDSWQKLEIPATRFDELRHEYPSIIWVIIFQQNGKGGTRGGVASDFDAPIQLKVRKVDKTFKNNYVEVIKNRGNPASLNLKYLIQAKKTISLTENNQTDGKKK